MFYNAISPPSPKGELFEEAFFKPVIKNNLNRKLVVQSYQKTQPHDRSHKTKAARKVKEQAAEITHSANCYSLPVPGKSIIRKCRGSANRAEAILFALIFFVSFLYQVSSSRGIAGTKKKINSSRQQNVWTPIMGLEARIPPPSPKGELFEETLFF